jgi:Ca2+-binding EF-hand superfamily protein
VNPLTPSVDLLALDAKELEQWIAVFGKFDKQKEGAITLDRIFETIEETPTGEKLFCRCLMLV